MTRDRTTRRATHAARLLALGLVALLLAGCFKFDTALTVSSDDTVSGTIIFGVDRALLEMGGGSLDDLMGQGIAPVPDDVEGVTVEEWEDEDFVGQEFTLDAVPLEAFNEDGEAGALRIERDGDVFRLNGNMDLSSGLEDLGGEDLGGMDPSAFLGSVELDISVTFPGEVLETNGEVEGTTVTWEPEIGSANEIIAVAEAEPSIDGSGILWILLVVGLLVLALVLYLLLRRRRRPMVTTGEPLDGGPTEASVGATTTGPAPPGQATPDAATPPPPPGGAPTAAPPPSPTPPAGGDDTTELPGSRDDTTPMPPPPPPV